VRAPRPRVRAAALATAVALAAAPAAMGSGLQQFYDNVAAFSNVTGPQAYKGQAMHIYTGGSLFLRSPQQTYSLMNFTPPSVRAGCGGIDLFAGSFSFINSDQLVAMMRNIGQNALGLIFLQGMQALCPECAEAVKYLQKLSQEMNSFNINSCEAAKALVSGSSLENFLETNRLNVVLGSVKHALHGDFTKARDELSKDSELKTKQQTLSSSDPQIKERLAEGNLVWKALRQAHPHVSEQELRWAMSLTGTLIYPPVAHQGEQVPRYVDYTLDFDALLGDTNGVLKREVITCIDGTSPDQCVVTGTENLAGDSLKQIAIKRMTRVYEKIRTRGGILDNADKGFINASSVPVYKIIATAAALPREVIAGEYQIEKNAEIIGAEMAAVFVLRSLDIVEKALAGRRFAASKTEEAQLKNIIERVRDVRSNVGKMRIAYAAKLNKIPSLMQEVSFLEKTFLGNLSDRVAGNVRFSRQLRNNH
jgi:conjugative transfer pilus assembly protein TraH